MCAVPGVYCEDVLSHVGSWKKNTNVEEDDGPNIEGKPLHKVVAHTINKRSNMARKTMYW